MTTRTEKRKLMKQLSIITAFPDWMNNPYALEDVEKMRILIDDKAARKAAKKNKLRKK